jgi:tetratricopeptide (TPR) repeat protein/transcriptional regulator with XRE-family HTH domain
MEPVAEPALRFAGLLRRLRTEARLTQEELAGAAGLSPRSVSDLERGINRTARRDTALLLADALSLGGQVRVLFVAAARGRAPAAEVLAARRGAVPGASAAATRALPRDIGSFTGREPELARLLGALADLAGGGLAGIHAIDGMAGIGKTTLAVHAAHQLAGNFPDGQFFLPLHAHTPGQRPVDPADALASLLLTAGVAVQHIPPGLEARAAWWRDHVAGQRILLLLDDAAGHEQVRPLLPGTAGSLVLITSRRRLTALEDAAVISIDTLSPDEAATLLARLAGRADLGSADGPAGEITRLCGYLPLAIGMLARQLRHHPARTAAELAADLAAARDRLAVMRTENLSVAAAFDLSYADLTATQQRLFRRLGLAPGPDIDAYAAAALDDTSLDSARGGLDELYDHHLVTEPARGRYLLHDLLREYARALADADDTAESRAAGGRLVSYYAHVAAAASRHIATWTTAGGRPPPGRPPAMAPKLATAPDAAAWLEAERPSLHASVDWAAAHAMPGHAVAIATAMGGFLRARGHWDQAAGQYQTALSAARRAGDRPGQAGALDELGLLQQLTGDYPAAEAGYERALALVREVGSPFDEGDILCELGMLRRQTGDYRAAAACQHQALDLFRRLGDRLGQAWALDELGLVLQVTGDYPEAAASLQQSLRWHRELGARHAQAVVLNSLGELSSRTSATEEARDHHGQALAIARDLGAPREEARALEGIGQSLLPDSPAEAATWLRDALAIYRRIGAPGARRVLDTLSDHGLAVLP